MTQTETPTPTHIPTGYVQLPNLRFAAKGATFHGGVVRASDIVTLNYTVEGSYRPDEDRTISIALGDKAHGQVLTSGRLSAAAADAALASILDQLNVQEPLGSFCKLVLRGTETDHDYTIVRTSCVRSVHVASHGCSDGETTFFEVVVVLDDAANGYVCKISALDEWAAHRRYTHVVDALANRQAGILP